MKGNDFILLDGGMGTMLQAAGLPLGARPEVFGLEKPEIVEGIQRQYADAGSDVLYANTFGANAHKLAGTGVSVEDAVAGNIKIARRAAAGRGVRVALDVGPVGELLEPLGTLSFDEAYALYRQMVMAGESAGADIIVFETFTDLNDARAALLAAKENSSLPVWVTMSFEESGRTFTGTTVSAMGLTLTGLGADAVGINCSLGPAEILPLTEQLRRYTRLPLIVKPNAGLPDPATGEYRMTAEEFGRQMEDYLPLGVMAVGGCCGTTPAFIERLAAMRESAPPAAVLPREAVNGVCSAAETVRFGGVRVVGERLNPTGKKRFQQALKDGDMAYIMEKAVEQADAGADILDVNVGVPGVDEPALMTRVVRAVQSVTSLPLQIDSSEPAAIEAGLRACCGRAIVNSVNGSDKSMDGILPLVKRYGAAVIGLTMDSGGIPQTAEERLAIARRIVARAERYGIERDDIIIDCLTLTVSAQQEQAGETLRAMELVRRELGVHCALGVSNISFGLPEREVMTQAFLTQAMRCGLDFPIINPNQKGMMDAVACHKVLTMEDRDCEAYIARFADRGTEKQPAPEAGQMTIEEAIGRGLQEETGRLARRMLAEMDEMELVNAHLIPALDAVGERYEKQIIFLPQLINAANAACAGFDVVRNSIAQKGTGSISKGKIVLATVEGDIHDIGKNIVKVVLENYGYQVIDLGRDVPVNKVAEAVVEHDVPLVGLSALMTTTVISMQRTIEAIRATGHPCKIMVGGAVLTPEYAERIGADFYARDARQSAEIAKKVIG